MRWSVLLLLLVGCDHFELEARITVRSGHGQLQHEGRHETVLEQSHGFFDLSEALEEPALFIVRNGAEHELPLSVAGCRLYRPQLVHRAVIDYELVYERDQLLLRVTGGSCISGHGSSSIVLD